MLIFSILITGLVGTIKSFSINYLMFIALEFLEPALGSGILSSAFILLMEISVSKHRVLGASFISIMFAVGEVILGIIAYFVRDWRLLFQILYIPTILFISYYWLIPDSVRWLIVKGRNEEAIEILQKIGKINKKKLSKISIQEILDQRIESSVQKSDFKAFINSSLLTRLVICMFIWMTNALVYYGINLNSMLIEGSQHVNFILVCAIEIPAYILNNFLSRQVGRRWTIFSSLFICAISVFCSGFLSDYPWIKLILFLIGKFAIALAFVTMYVFTAELFPTNLRHRCIGLCSMFGNVGAMVAPQTTVMVCFYELLFIDNYANLIICYRVNYFQICQQYLWQDLL